MHVPLPCVVAKCKTQARRWEGPEPPPLTLVVIGRPAEVVNYNTRARIGTEGVEWGGKG